MAKSITWTQPNEAVFSGIKYKTESRETHKQTATIGRAERK